MPPRLYLQYAALRGDPSDNLPGVPGVGEKTAAKLINTYGGIDGIFEHLDEQSPKLRANLAEHEASIRQNAEIMVLVRDVPVGVTVDDLDRKALDVDEVRRLFDFLEFHSLAERLTEALGEDLGPRRPAGRGARGRGHRAETPADAVRILGEVRRGRGRAAGAGGGVEGSEGRTPLEGLAVVTDPARATWRGCRRVAGRRRGAGRTERAGGGPRGGRPIAAHQAKAVMRSLLDAGVDVRAWRSTPPSPPTCSTPPSLATCSTRTAAATPRSSCPRRRRRPRASSTSTVRASAPPAHGPPRPGRRPADRAAHRRARRPVARQLNDEIEVPLVRVLARMEHAAWASTPASCGGCATGSPAEVERLRQAIWDDAGIGEFNVNSTPQLREILFDKLGLTPQKKTKTGYSTDASSLEKLAGQHPIVDHLLAYREVEKLRSTYGEGLLAEVAADGRIHATFNQTVARTGRLSSDQPNLHNIPVRSEVGREFRQAFVPARAASCWSPTTTRSSCAASPTWPRTPGLIDASPPGRHPHRDRVADLRRRAGRGDDRPAVQGEDGQLRLAYGMEAYGLGQRLNIPTEEAAVILDAYFEAFPPCASTWTARWPRPASGATPRRCSAAAARSPSCRRPTSGSARPASARR